MKNYEKLIIFYEIHIFKKKKLYIWSLNLVILEKKKEIIFIIIKYVSVI